MAYQQGQPITVFDSFTVGGVATNPTLLVYSVLAPDGTTTTYSWPGAPEITNAATGEFEFALGAPSLPGLYQYDVDATGAVVASRAATFTVLPNATGVIDDLDWAIVGPCTPWADSQDVWSCCGQPMTTIGEGSSETECPVDMSQFAMEASQVLYELSGRQFSGACERTVRPCGQEWCGFQVLSRGHIVGWDGSWWGSNGRSACGCRHLSRVQLSGYPVRDIVEVKIDGDVVDPDTYRLDERRWLSRVRDPAEPDTVLLWPRCQHLDLDDTQDGTFSVTYRYGQDPPLSGQAAAAQLGCELYKACSGQSCALPTGTTRINRQGIVIERLAFAAWAFNRGSGSQAPGWHTGLPLVDAFLGEVNATAMKRRPTIWSADSYLRFARSVGQ